jgi:hypothetical protein
MTPKQAAGKYVRKSVTLLPGDVSIGVLRNTVAAERAR